MRLKLILPSTALCAATLAWVGPVGEHEKGAFDGLGMHLEVDASTGATEVVLFLATEEPIHDVVVTAQSSKRPVWRFQGDASQGAGISGFELEQELSSLAEARSAFLPVPTRFERRRPLAACSLGRRG